MKDLFEDLRNVCGCAYISDLRYFRSQRSVLCGISRLCISDYSLHQWNDLAEYLFGEKKEFASEDNIREYLREKLSSELHR